MQLRAEELGLIQQIQQNDQGCNCSKSFIQIGVPLNLITDFSSVQEGVKDICQ